MSEQLNIFFAGGGTGGHLYPGISVAQEVVRAYPECKPVFLCTQRPIDKTILDPTGFEYITQPIQPPVKSVGGLINFWKSWRDTREQLSKLIKDRKPAAILGLGGYAAGVAVKHCSLKKIPAAILNPDVIPGKANQYLLRYVTQVCCQFESTRQCLPGNQRQKMVVTGCPIRPDMFPLPERAEAAKRLGIDPNLNTLTITGASQGAQTVNDAVLECLKSQNLQGWNIIHLAGKDHVEKVRTEYRQMNIPAIVIDFTPTMNDIWACTDLAICRSGASTCAELTSAGIASILMPYPFHKDMHQRANAKELADANAAFILDDQKDRRKNAGLLLPILVKMLADGNARRSMAGNARKLARHDAAAHVAKIVREMIVNKG